MNANELDTDDTLAARTLNERLTPAARDLLDDLDRYAGTLDVRAFVEPDAVYVGIRTSSEPARRGMERTAEAYGVGDALSFSVSAAHGTHEGTLVFDVNEVRA